MARKIPPLILNYVGVTDINVLCVLTLQTYSKLNSLNGTVVKLVLNILNYYL